MKRANSYVIYPLLLILFLLIQHQQNYCQDLKADSIRQLIENAYDIEEKIDLYINLMSYYRSFDINKARQTGEFALKISENLSGRSSVGKIYAFLGDLAIASDSIDVAEKYYGKALEEYELQQNEKGVVSVLIVLGNIAFLKDRLSDALEYYLHGMEIAEKKTFIPKLNTLNLNLGVIYSKSGQNLKSKEYFTKALNGFIKEKDTLELAVAYLNLGEVAIELEKYNEAFEFLLKAKRIFQSKNAHIRGAYVNHKLATIDYKKGNYNEALRKLKVAGSMAEKNIPQGFEGPKTKLIQDIYLDLGKTYLAIMELDRCKYWVESALKLNAGDLPVSNKAEAMGLLYSIWQQKKDADSALFYHILFKAYSDTLNAKINSRQLALLEGQFRYKQRTEEMNLKREIEKQKQNRNFILLLVALIILILLIILLILRLRLNRIKMSEIQTQQKILEQEIETKNKELATYLMFQVKNNEFILNISKKLKEIFKKSGEENRRMLGELISSIEGDTIGENWDEFIIRFQQVHTEFYKNLGKNYPDLTSNELRLCAFLKLNMNTKDIASITYQSTKSITVARWRLRKKLGLKKEERLSAFLARF